MTDEQRDGDTRTKGADQPLTEVETAEVDAAESMAAVEGDTVDSADEPTAVAPEAGHGHPDEEVVLTTEGDVRGVADANDVDDTDDSRDRAADDDLATIPADEVRDPQSEHEHPDARPMMRVTLPPTLTVLLGLAAGVIAIAGLKQVAGIVAPTFLAATLIIAVYPVYKFLRKVLGGVIAGLLLIVILYGILAFLGASIGVAASKFASELAKPEYTSTFTGLISDARQLLTERGIEAQEIDDAIANFDLRNLTGLASSLANTVTGLTTTMLFLLTVMIFLVMDAGGFGRRLSAIHRQKPDVADALVDFGYRVRKYWIVSTVFGVIVAVIDYGALMWLGVPLAMTFGLLSFVTNYIPNVGFVLGLIPPAFIALLSGGVSTMVWVIVIYCVANFFIQTILQPKFTGDAVGINASTAFLSLVFWTYVFGALGALLAIPFTLLVKSLLIDRDPRARWINQFIASDPAEVPSTQPS